MFLCISSCIVQFLGKYMHGIHFTHSTNSEFWIHLVSILLSIHIVIKIIYLETKHESHNVSIYHFKTDIVTFVHWNSNALTFIIIIFICGRNLDNCNYYICSCILFASYKQNVWLKYFITVFISTTCTCVYCKK